MVPLQAVRVSDQLGGRKVFAKHVSTYDGLRRAVEKGLPHEAVVQTLAFLPESARARSDGALSVSRRPGAGNDGRNPANEGTRSV